VAAAGTVWALVILGRRGAVAGLQVSVLGIVFALTSAVATAFMFLGSAPLVRALGVQSSTGLGLAIGGIPMLLWAPPWAGHATGDHLAVAALVMFAVLGGTALAFSLSFPSLRQITPTEVAVTSSVEPAVAALTSFIFVGLTLQPLQYVGGTQILAAVIILAHAGRFAPR
jgi:drug/metabolite transporter (DMT)-like permease